MKISIKIKDPLAGSSVPSHCSLAMAKKPKASDTARIRDRFERLLSAGVEIFSEHTLTAVLQKVVDTARDVVGARYAALGVLGPDGAALSEFVTSGMTADERAKIGALPVGHGLLGMLIRHPKPLRVADIPKHSKSAGFPAHHPPMRSFLGVPVVSRGNNVFGNLYLTEKIGAPEFSEEDEAIAILLASSAAAAIENVRLNEEARNLLAQVQSMQRQRDLFFAMMNHELRNALTGVFGWAEMLVRGRDGAPVPQAAREVYEGTERTIELLNNFLDLTRLDANRVKPVIRDLDPTQVVERACSGVRLAAESKQVKLETVCPPDLPHPTTDQVRVQQILVNLLSNAVRHTSAGSTVTTAVSVSGPDMLFRVTDQGPGVPDSIRDGIFEPFLRFDPHSGLGTGLGLPVSRRLAEVLGGSLSVEQSSPRGATFLLQLPLRTS
ncbi:MAG TPA: GAF domain-containing sensor histidine kinase [Gemmatimonadales bacterium]|nr:GAF domain-containing sensor histidine kinase [Gemmatimonadales bacterium]